MFNREIQPLGSRQEVMDQAVQDYVRRGYRIETGSGWNVVMVRGKRVNHMLHFLVGLLTFATWWLVWLFLVIFNSHRRVNIYVNEYLEVKVSKV